MDNNTPSAVYIDLLNTHSEKLAAFIERNREIERYLKSVDRQLATIRDVLCPDVELTPATNNTTVEGGFRRRVGSKLEAFWDTIRGLDVGDEIDIPFADFAQGTSRKYLRTVNQRSRRHFKGTVANRDDIYTVSRLK